MAACLFTNKNNLTLWTPIKFMYLGSSIGISAQADVGLCYQVCPRGWGGGGGGGGLKRDHPSTKVLMMYELFNRENKISIIKVFYC